MVVPTLGGKDKVKVCTNIYGTQRLRLGLTIFFWVQLVMETIVMGTKIQLWSSAKSEILI